MQTKQITWSTRNGFFRLSTLSKTGVKAVDTATAAMLEEHAEYGAAKRAHEVAQATVAGLADEARAAAHEAGLLGTKPDKKGLKKRRNAALEAAEDAELDWITAESRIQKARLDYLEVLAHHAPALTAAAKGAADAGVLELASALGIAREAEAKVTHALSTLGGLPALAGGDDFSPAVPKPRKTTADEFDDSGHPGIHATLAVESLQKAIMWAQRLIEQIAADEKDRERAAKLDAEAEAAEEDEDDDDDLDEDER